MIIMYIVDNDATEIIEHEGKFGWKRYYRGDSEKLIDPIVIDNIVISDNDDDAIEVTNQSDETSCSDCENNVSSEDFAEDAIEVNPKEIKKHFNTNSGEEDTEREEVADVENSRGEIKFTDEVKRTLNYYNNSKDKQCENNEKNEISVKNTPMADVEYDELANCMTKRGTSGIGLLGVLQTGRLKHQ